MTTKGVNNNGFIHDNGQSQSKETNFEKVERMSFGTKHKTDDGHLTDDYDPYEHRQIVHPISNFDTMVHLLKSALGTGIFSVPLAFSHSGYFVGVIGTILLGSIATYCVHLIINIHYDLCKKKRVPSMTYPYIAEAALMYGPKPLRKFAPYMVHVINAFLLLYQIGACSIYIVFISENVKALYDYAFDTVIDKRYVMVAILLPLIFVNWIQNLKYMSPFSTIGNCVTIIAFGVISYYIFREPLSLDDRKPYGKLSEFPQFFGTVLFALEAIGTVMPLENEMKNPKDFRGPTGILNRSMVLVVILYMTLGLCGYIKYGPNIKSTITLNLPSDELVAQIAKGLIACGVFLTHIVANYVSIDILWTEYIVKRVEDHPRKSLFNYGLRTATVFLTFVLAVTIQELDLFIGLVGALALSTLGVLFPPILDTCTRWYTTSGGSKAWMLLRNFIIGCIGLAGFVIGTTLSIEAIILNYTSESKN